MSFIFSITYIMSLYNTFKSTIVTDLFKELKKDNIHQVPKIDKVVVAMWVWSLATRKWVKDFSDLESQLIAITWQQPHMILSKKSVSNFKLREGMPAMLKVTLRWERAYGFIERMSILTLPRVRDFSWVSSKKFDGNWNYSMWFKSQAVFAEIVPEEIKNQMWVQVTISTTADTDTDAKSLLQHLWIIFEKKQVQAN